MSLPVNLGNPEEYSIESLATLIVKMVGSGSELVYEAGVQDDPQRRKPDITRAETHLHWSPKISLLEGLRKTFVYFKKEILHHHAKESEKENLWMAR